MHQFYLEVVNELGGKYPALRFDVTRFPCIVGRHPDCGRRIDLPFVSRHHCRLFLRDGGVWVEDLASHNGTYLNGVRVTLAQQLLNGDRLDIGHLPLRVSLQAAPELVAARDAAEGGQQRILVVEDDPDAAETLAVLLRQMGHEVHVAHDGTEALRQAEAQVPDTVLLDIRLPGMDGYEVARRLREREAARATRVVGITGYHGPEDGRRSAEVGMERLLTKPVVPGVLEEVIRR